MILKRVKTVTFDGASYSSTKQRDYNNADVRRFTGNPGIKGVLTTRTSNTAGVVTLTAGHGLATGDDLRLFAPDGGCYTLTHTITGNALTITGITQVLFTYNSVIYNESLFQLPILNAAVVIGKGQVLDIATVPVVANPIGLVFATDQSPASFKLFYNTGPVQLIQAQLYNEKIYEYLLAGDQRVPGLTSTMANIDRLTWYAGNAVAANIKVAFLY